jgi:hypothetical protein
MSIQDKWFLLKFFQELNLFIAFVRNRQGEYIIERSYLFVHIFHILTSEQIQIISESLEYIQNYVMLHLLCFCALSIVLFLFKTQRFGDWIPSPSSGGTESLYILNKNRTMDNAQKHSKCINILSSQTFRC